MFEPRNITSQMSQLCAGAEPGGASKFFLTPSKFFSNTWVAHPQPLIKGHLHYTGKAFSRLRLSPFHIFQVADIFTLMSSLLRKEEDEQNGALMFFIKRFVLINFFNKMLFSFCCVVCCDLKF